MRFFWLIGSVLSDTGLEWWHLVLAGLLIFGQAGAAWMILKTMLNGVRKDLRDHIDQARETTRDLRKSIDHRREREANIARELALVRAELTRFEQICPYWDHPNHPHKGTDSH